MIGYFICLVLILGLVNLFVPFLFKPVLFGGVYLGGYMLVQQYQLAAPLFWVLLVGGPVLAAIWVARTKANADSGAPAPAADTRALLKSFLGLACYYLALICLPDMAGFTGGLLGLLGNLPAVPGLILLAVLSAATLALGRAIRNIFYQAATQQ